MRIYLAARYVRREELCGYAEQLRECGHTVECRWLNGSHQWHPGADKVDGMGESVPMEARAFAIDDLEDLALSDWVISFTERPYSDTKGRGSRHVEFGLAIAKGKRLIVVGPRENVFHCLPKVEHFNSFDECLKAIG